MPSSYSCVPLLDLSDYTSENSAKRAAFVRDLGDAFVNLGFIRIKNFGVATAVIEDVYAACRAFFAGLDGPAKHRYILPGLNGARGHTPFGQEHAKDSEMADLKEFFHVGQELPEDSTSPWAKSSFYHPNVWPTEVPSFRPSCEHMFKVMERTGQLLLRAVAEYLEIEAGFFEPSTKDGLHILRLLHYPPVPPDADKRSLRAAAHEDINLITLLPTATSSGLQIKPSGTDRWLDVVNGPNELIVDTGDMLHRLCPLFPSTTHRVTNPDDTSVARYSLPFFMHPNPDAMLDWKTLPQNVQDRIVAAGITPEPGIRAHAFLVERLAAIGLCSPGAGGSPDSARPAVLGDGAVPAAASAM